MSSTLAHLWISAFIRTAWCISPRLPTAISSIPLEVVSVGDIVEVQVLSVDLKKQRIGLTMKIRKESC